MINLLNKALFITLTLAILTNCLLAYALSDIKTTIHLGHDTELALTTAQLLASRAIP